MNIMNALSFGKTKSVPEPILDGNFISIYNSRTERFHYFVHRLNFIEIENANNPGAG